VSSIGDIKGAYRVLLGKREGKRLLGRPRHRRDKIKMDLQRVLLGGLDYVDLVQNRDK
jgi:hypothetical protein